MNLVDIAPEMKVGLAFLDRVASWSTEEHRGIPLRALIGARMPDVADRIGVQRFVPEAYIKRAHELTGAELKEIVCLQVRGMPEGESIYSGDIAIPASQLEDEVRNGTPTGIRLIEATRRSLRVIEQLLEDGKIVIDPSLDHNPNGQIVFPF